MNKTARAVHANRGVEAAYRRRLQALVKEMEESVIYWVKAGYRADEPRMAQDETPSELMNRRLEKLSRRWVKRFESMSEKIARWFQEDMFGATDAALFSAFREAGWTVKFKSTPAMNDVAKANVIENVGLIKSIPEKYFTEIQGAVMRGYSRGRDLKQITDDIEHIGGVTRRRAAFIARDQSNKLHGATTDARRKELGITDAIWQHSGAGKEPRPDHVAAHGKQYKIAEGCLISGDYIQPGELINCRCTSKSVLPF